MKISKILLILVLALSVVSCKKNDDNTVEAFVLNNANIAGTHDLTYFTASSETTITVQGIPLTVTTSTTADTYQATITFTEAGAYTLDGEFRTITTITPGGGTPLIQIVTWNETGTFQANSNAQTIVLTETGSAPGDELINMVTLFNETEFRVTSEETYTEPNGGTTTDMAELRFVRQ